MMNRISATNAARNFSDLINRVRYQGATFEIESGNEVIARIVPATPSTTLSIADLDEQWAQLPRLDPEDAELFEANIYEIRQNATFSQSMGPILDSNVPLLHGCMLNSMPPFGKRTR